MSDQNKTVIETLPFIEDLQSTLMSGFLQDRKLWVRMYPHIVHFYFSNKHLQKIFKIWTTYFEKHKEFPTIEVMNNFAFRMKADDEMTNMVAKIYKQNGALPQHEIDYLYGECNKFIKEQKIKTALLRGVDLMNEGKYDEIETDMRAAVSWNSDINLGSEIHHAKERYEQLDELYADAIPWPWQRMRTFSEGMLRKQLYVVASSSSVGKSIFLDNVAWYTWFELKKNVISITLELSELMKGKRMDSFGLKLPAKTIREQKDKIIKFYEDNTRDNRLYIKEFPTSQATIDKDIRNYLYNLELYVGLHKKDIGLIIIDYGDIVKPKRVTGNQYVDLGVVFETMRALAIEYDVPVLSATQLSKLVVKEQMTPDELTEATLAESFKKMHISDWLMAMMNTPEERVQGIINFKVLKDRDGQKDLVLPMRIDYPSLRIFDVTSN